MKKGLLNKNELARLAHAHGLQVTEDAAAYIERILRARLAEACKCNNGRRLTVAALAEAGIH